MADLDTSVWPPRYKGSFFKGPRGKHEAERREKRAAVKAHDKAEKREAAKVAPGCRWPRWDHPSPRHVCQGQLEGAHRVAVGMGGDRNGTRTDRREVLIVCSLIHTWDGEGLERHGREWRPLTEQGTLGPVSFWRRLPLEGKPGEWGDWICIGVEVAPGVIDKRSRRNP